MCGAAYKMSMFGMFQHPPTQRGLFLILPPKPFLAIIKASQVAAFFHSLFHLRTKSSGMERIIFNIVILILLVSLIQLENLKILSLTRICQM